MTTIPFSNETLISPKDLASAGVLSLVKQWELRKRGILPHYKLSGKILYSEAQIKAYFAACAQGGNTDGGAQV